MGASIPNIMAGLEAVLRMTSPVENAGCAFGYSCPLHQFLIASAAEEQFPYAPPLARHFSHLVFRLWRGRLRIALPRVIAKIETAEEEEGGAGEKAVRVRSNAFANREHAPAAHVRGAEVRRRAEEEIKEKRVTNANAQAGSGGVGHAFSD
jgi:hypothetical protein